MLSLMSKKNIFAKNKRFSLRDRPKGPFCIQSENFQQMENSDLLKLENSSSRLEADEALEDGKDTELKLVVDIHNTKKFIQVVFIRGIYCFLYHKTLIVSETSQNVSALVLEIKTCTCFNTEYCSRIILD